MDQEKGMIFDLSLNALFTADKVMVKQFTCPLRKKWEELSWTESEYKRYCSSCEKPVIDITEFQEEQIIALFKVQPDACAYLDFHKTKCNFEFINEKPSRNESTRQSGCKGRNHQNLVVINTARNIEAINRGTQQGYQVLLRSTSPDDAIEQKVTIIQDSEGNYAITGYDFRNNDWNSNPLSTLKSNLNPSPFAGYLVPRNLPKNTRVFIPDIIEHIVSSSWNQGDEWRQKSGEGTWDGLNVILDEIPPTIILG
ncbi:hypothetical protein AB4343_14905 [Vibrio breoganii]|uniref:Uncharacterized protein n=1 Tax=Vibrio breoganii TaxID=553239 RepID=A0AAP8SV23_9VIBR|nr:hypothetical protein [Vibrio breoganii]PMP05815.1 hypothetical protein BCS93_18225 [Vibrio breoganii]